MSFSERWINRRSRRLSSPDQAVVRRPTAVVLSGGSVFGAAQVGQLRALLEAGIVPDLLVGCSVGALNAAFMAAQPDLDAVGELEDIWLGLQSGDVFGFRSSRTLAAVLRGSSHLCSPDGLRNLIARFCPVEDLAHTAIHLEVVTTDLDNARPTWWSSGPASDILLASAALPAIFPPVLLDGRRHVDGGVLVPVPTNRALDLGAADVFVCDVSSRGRPQLPSRLGVLSSLLEAFNVARFGDGSEARPAEDQRVVVLPTPDLEGMSMLDFGQTPRLISTAYELAAQALSDPTAAAMPLDVALAEAS